MKIVRIIARLNIGGPARNAVLLSEGCSRLSLEQDLVRGLASNKWETVLVCGEVGADEGDMMYLAREKGIEPVIVPELGRELSFRNDWRAFWKICGIICRERPDIVHTHTAKAGALGRIAACLCKVKGKRCKVVHTFHGHALSGYFGCVKSLVFLWAEKILALFTDRIVTVSGALKKELVDKYRIAPEEKIQEVDLGFDLGELLNLSLKEAGDVVKIGIVGRLVPVKNHRMLFRVVQMVHKWGQFQRTGAVPIYKFVVIGDGELRQELENYAKELGIGDIVEFKGWVKDLREIYEELDIVALTSLNEGTPVSIIEAMAAARPVVATAVGGVSDVVEDGKNGYLVKSNDDEAFAERLLDLVKDQGKRKKFGECGRELVKVRFSKERLIDDMEKLYNRCLKNEGAKR